MIWTRVDLSEYVSRWVASLMISLLPHCPGVRSARSHDTPGGPGYVAIHPQRGSSQAAGQEPPDVHLADHQADPHCSAGVWRHPAASPCCTTALRLYQCQRRQGWVYVHAHIHNTLTWVSCYYACMLLMRLDRISCATIICKLCILWVS